MNGVKKTKLKGLEHYMKIPNLMVNEFTADLGLDRLSRF